MFRATTLLLLLFLFVALVPKHIEVPQMPALASGYVGPVVKETNVLFVGDVMLARYVETLIEQNNPSYPFARVANLLKKYDYVVGNFEAPIPVIHEPTPKDSLDFSVASTSVLNIGNYFSHLSLANNHTFDKGQAGLDNTRTVLSSNGSAVFGDPNTASSSVVSVIDQGDYAIVLHGLHLVSGYDATSTISSIQQYESGSAVQVAYIHWGNEYEEQHSLYQEAIAWELIDAGIDVVVGHHPHVVQDVGWYKGVPIFYSLGNFVFDQYFSEDTQTHLTLAMTIENNEVSFKLIPLKSSAEPSVPQFMSVGEQRAFLHDLAARSEPSLKQAIERGTIDLETELASL